MKKVLIALALLWPSLVSAQIAPYPLGVRPPIFGLPASAVNGGGTVTSPQLLLPEGSAAAPSLSFAATPTKGIYSLGGNDFAISTASAGRIGFFGGGMVIKSDYTLNWASSTIITASDLTLSRGAAGLLNVASGAFGIQFNTGTAAPTVGTCGTGTITAGSRNTTGSFTATGATACTVTFGAPAWTNAPFCTITAYGAPTTVPYINGAPTTTAFIIAGMTAGDNLLVGYHCVGRF